MNFGILRLSCIEGAKKGYYNMQELGLAKCIKKYGYNVYIFLLNKKIKSIKAESYGDSITIINVPCKGIGNHGIFNISILNKYKIKYLQILSDNQIYATSVMKYCNNNDIKYYNYVGTLQSDSKRFINKLFNRIIMNRNIKWYRKSTNYAKTPNVVKQFKSMNINNVILLPVGLDLDEIKIDSEKNEIINKYKLPAGKEYIAFVGKLEKYKNPFDLLEIMEKLPEKFHVIIIGNGKLKNSFINKINSKHFQCTFSYFERLTNREIHEIYSISSYSLNFNRVEIYGMSILEALYNGVTVIAYHAPGPDYILDNNMGYLVNNTNEMAEIVINGKRINSKTVHDKFIEKFTWDESARIIYESFLCTNLGEK